MDAMQEPEVWELLERLSRVAKSHGARCDSVICKLDHRTHMSVYCTASPSRLCALQSATLHAASSHCASVCMVAQERPRSHAPAATAALWLRGPAPCRPTSSCSAQDIHRPAALDLCRRIPLKRGWFQARRLLCEVHEDFQLNMTLAAHGYWVCPLPR